MSRATTSSSALVAAAAEEDEPLSLRRARRGAARPDRRRPRDGHARDRQRPRPRCSGHRGAIEELRADRVARPRRGRGDPAARVPAQGLFRETTRDVGLGGVLLPKGARLMVHFGSANRDAAVFGADAAALRPAARGARAARRVRQGHPLLHRGAAGAARAADRAAARCSSGCPGCVAPTTSRSRTTRSSSRAGSPACGCAGTRSGAQAPSSRSSGLVSSGSKPSRAAISSLDGRVPSRKSPRSSSPVSGSRHQSSPTSSPEVLAQLGRADPRPQVVGRVEAAVHVRQVVLAG